MTTLFTKNLILILLLSLFSNKSLAQEVKGTIRNVNDSLIIEDVVIYAKAKNFQKSVLSDSKGTFSIVLPTSIDSVSLHFSHISYIPKVFIASKGSELSVFLSSVDNLLNEVVIKPSFITHKNGKVIVDISQIPNSENLNIKQVLNYMPGVTTDKNGSYSLNGRPSTVFINGIKQNISAGSLESFLSNLPSDAVSSIELININSGTFDASIESVIDIKTNPNMALGYSFQPYIYSSFFPKGLKNFGGNVFYMTKFNRILFHNTISYSNKYSYRKSIDSLIINDKKVISSNNLDTGRTNVFTYQASLTYTLKNKHSLNINTFIYNDFGKQQANWLSITENSIVHKKSRSDLYNLSASYQIPNSYKKFNGTITYAISYGGEYNNNIYYDNYYNIYCNSNNNMEGWMNTLNASFNSQINRFQISYGTQLDYNKVWNKTDYLYENKNNDYLSKFSGYEILSAGYIQSKFILNDKLSLTAGGRLENTYYKYLFNTNKSVNYTKLFPSLLLYYDTSNYNLIVGFTSYIKRPNYEWMIPGLRQLNEYIYVIGNPDIKPVNTYGLILYNTFFKYAQLNLLYVLTQNMIGSVYSVEKELLFESKSNIADNRSVRLNMVLPFALFNRKLTGQIQFNTSYNKLSTFRNGFVAPANRHSYYWIRSYDMIINYAPIDRCNISIQCSYSPERNTPLNTIGKNTMLDIEAYYSFLKEKNLIISLSVSDLFLNNNISTSYFLNNRNYSTNIKYTPSFLISLKFKLNNGQKVIEEYKDYFPSTSRLR